MSNLNFVTCCLRCVHWQVLHPWKHRSHCVFMDNSRFGHPIDNSKLWRLQDIVYLRWLASVWWKLFLSHLIKVLATEDSVLIIGWHIWNELRNRAGRICQRKSLSTALLDYYRRSMQTAGCCHYSNHRISNLLFRPRSNCTYLQRFWDPKLRSWLQLWLEVHSYSRWLKQVWHPRRPHCVRLFWQKFHSVCGNRVRDEARHSTGG